MPFPILPSNSASGYFLTKSLRFRSSASAYLNRTPSTAGNRRTYTWSGWVKRGSLTAPGKTLFDAYAGVNDRTHLQFDNNQIRFFNNVSGSIITEVRSTQVFRDPSAWYHFVLAVDTTQATASDRVKLYVNGSQITALTTATYQSQNTDTYINSTNVHDIGVGGAYADEYFDGYLAEVNFIDGQALTPSSFGETSTTTGVWIPKKYTGTYGTNGFYLPFTDTTSTSTLGTDFSGNSNTWTVNGISLTTGSTYDSMTDVPTLTSATTANYCVMNPLRVQNISIAAGTLSDGNLKITTSASDNAYSNHYGTMAFPRTGQWYFETVFAGAFGNDAGNYAGITGVSDGSASCNIVVTSTTEIQKNFSNVQTGLSFSAGDILGIAFDATNLTVNFYKNGSAFGSQVTGLNSVEYTPFILAANPANTQSSWTLNFGQQPFAHTPPTGFVALNTFNLPTPTIGATASTQANKYFDATLYTGNGSTQTITNSGSMQPDFVWSKNRSNARSHALVDSVRGATLQLQSNTTSDEFTGGFASLNSNGFTVNNNFNENNTSETYVGWQWKANGTAVTNTAGTISAQVSANTTAGFSVVTYTGVGGSGTTTVGHGLNVSPSMVIIKRRNSTADWATYHTGLTSTSYYLFLNSTAGQANYGSTFISPSSSTLTIDAGSSLLNTSTGTYVAYCFAQVAGYSAFGSYTGNGDPNGTFVYLGFRPKFVLIKSTASGTNWVLHDSSREPFNEMGTNSIGYALNPENNVAESTNANLWAIDFTSNGFKNRSSSASVNSSGQTYIYMAFAENPFKYANAK